jgi:hypothetical protein
MDVSDASESTHSGVRSQVGAVAQAMTRRRRINTDVSVELVG